MYEGAMTALDYRCALARRNSMQRMVQHSSLGEVYDDDVQLLGGFSDRLKLSIARQMLMQLKRQQRRACLELHKVMW